MIRRAASGVFGRHSAPLMASASGIGISSLDVILLDSGLIKRTQEISGCRDERIKRHFAISRAKAQTNPNPPETSQAQSQRAPVAHVYDHRKSGEYLSFLRLDPVKLEMLTNTMNNILANIEKADRDKVIRHLKILFQLRIAYNSIAQTVWLETLDSLETKIEEKQRTMMLTEVNSFVDCLLAVSVRLTVKEKLQLLVMLTLSKLSSHRLLTGLVSPIIDGLDSFTFSEISSLVSSLKVQAHRYQKVTGYKLRNEDHFIMLEEVFLKDVLNMINLKTLLTKIAKLLPEQSLNTILETQLCVLRLLDKYVKLGGLNSPTKKFYFDKLTVKLFESIPDLPTLTPKNLKLYYFISGLIISHGRNSKLALKMFKEAEIQVLKSNKFDPWKMICYGIGTRNSHGDYDKQFYETIELPSISLKLKNSKTMTVSELISSMIIIYSMETKDPEIHKLILERVIEMEEAYRQKKYDIVHDIQMKGMHQWLSYGINCGIIPRDLVPMIAEVANRMTAQCLCNRHLREYKALKYFDFPEDIPELEISKDGQQKVKLLDCVNDDPSSRFIMQTFTEPKVEETQIYGDNYNETMIKEIVQNYLPMYFEMPFTAHFDLEAIQACTYKWDLVIKFRDIPQKVGLEVSGQAYTSDFSGFQQKKKIKLMVLENKGFLPVVIDVGASKMKGYIIESNYQIASVVIINEIRSQVLKHTNIDLNIKPERQQEFDRLVREHQATQHKTIMAKTENLAANNKIKVMPRKKAASPPKTATA
jgi:hypothetical protein